MSDSIIYIGFATVHLAAMYANNKMLKWCIDHGGSIHAPSGSAHRNMTAILIAAKYGHIETLVEIYKLGGRFEDVDCEG